MLLRGCGQWFRCGRDWVARPSEQETSIRDHKGIVVAKKMSRKVSRRVVRPACIAGVRISRPNFRAPCGRTEVTGRKLGTAADSPALMIPPAELEYVSDRNGRFQAALGKVQTADPLRVRVFDQTASSI